jgi:capsid protein
MLAGVLELPDSQMGVSSGDDEVQLESMDTIQLVRGMLLTVPGGGKVTQFKPEQPTTNYDTFVRAKLKEAGRCINVPYGRMAGDYTSHTYSGGRLEEELYWGDREIERDSFRAKVLDPWFHVWLDFARFALPVLAAYRGKWWELKHAWQYDARPTSDPVKDATGDELNLTNGTDTLADIAAREGLTEDELLDKRAATMRKFQERGLPLPPWLTGAPAVPRPGDGQPQNPADAKAEALSV